MIKKPFDFHPKTVLSEWFFPFSLLVSKEVDPGFSKSTSWGLKILQGRCPKVQAS